MAAGLLLVVVALVAAVLATAPGHRALRNWAVSALAKQIDGTVSIGSVGGTLWRAATVRDITLATRDGRPVISADRVRVSFALTDLVRGRFRATGVRHKFYERLTACGIKVPLDIFTSCLEVN